MSARKRLSICYAAPGQYLLPSAGPTRNVLSVAKELSRWADVTVAFRTVLEPVETNGFKVAAIEPDAAIVAGARDDNATRGIHPLQHVSYCRTLWSFAGRQARAYDVVLEKGWRLSGYLLSAFRSHGVPGVLIENNVHLWSEPLTDLQTVSKYLMHVAALAIARRCSRRAAAVIAETEEMKEILVGQRRLSPGQVEVVGLGVDHGLFRPLDRQAARQALGIAPDAVVLLYVGAMDEYHDLEPVIEALASAGQPLVQLHVVGDGEYRPRCEKEARDGRVESRFYGHVPHAMVPQYIAASDLCIAPYRGSACHNNVIPFSTLKIPEYMACARPVVSVPSGPIQRLIDHQVSGYIFPNSVAQWSTFLRALPARERLAEMGIAAAQAVASIRWDVTARSYLSVCERVAA